MPARGPDARQAIPDARDRVFAAGDAVAEAKAPRARARAEEAIWRAIYRQSVEQAALDIFSVRAQTILLTINFAAYITGRLAVAVTP